MRLVIDLQFCQNADASATGAALSLAQELIRTAGKHTVWVAFTNQYPARIELLRAAFDGLLAPERLLVYDTPPPDGTERVQRTIELVRDNFFAALDADIVFAPQLFDHAIDTIGAIHGNGAPFLTAVSIANTDMLTSTDGSTPLRADSHMRSQASLGHADLLLATSTAIAERLRAVFTAHPSRIVEIGDYPVIAAQRAWDALELAYASRQPHPMPAERPALAYISPLPPQQSGIADYSAELIRELERFYDVHLIVPEILDFDQAIASAFEIHTVDWFEQHAHGFERILYHFGNSGLHRFMFDLLERWPGIVVLHDFFLSNVLYEIEISDGKPLNFRQAIYHSHGYSGLADRISIRDVQTVWKYPANKQVLDKATGIIVHSKFSLELAAAWYGPFFAERWKIVPLLRGKPADNGVTRADARRRLGFGDDDLVICSFGMMGQTKLNDRLLDAFASLDPQLQRRCRLVYVGAEDPSEYGVEFDARLASSNVVEQVTITGFVDADTYQTYLQSADIAVQLRGQTRGETSASILDCLLYEIATIVNANGSNAALPESVVVKLPNEFSVDQLRDALAALCTHPSERLALAGRGHRLVAEEHTPVRVGQLYAQAIEHFTQSSPSAHYRALLQGMARIGAPTDPRHYELVAAAKAIATNQPNIAPRQLFIDISAVVQFDLKTGIQRVVRSIVRSLINKPPAGFRVEPVYGDGGNRRYRYARRFTMEMIGEKELMVEDDPIEHRAGDVFLGLDLVAGVTLQNQELLADMRNHGIQIYFVIYDLLPLLLPNAFPYGTESSFRQYTEVIVRQSDGLVCISRAVADELEEWITAHAAPRRTPLHIGYFHLGADIAASIPTTGLQENAEQVFDAIAKRPTILMVGTVEPRKGHTQALEAFGLLWKQQVEVNLIIVGKAGWMVDSLVKNLKSHPEAEKRLFWLSQASDEMLTRLYEETSALLAASIGEGFGLPLIEAAQHQLPVIARNLPVFREVSGEHAFYFDGQDADDLARAVKEWLALDREGKAPKSDAMPWLSWADSADQLLGSIIEGRWYRTLPAA